MAYKETAERQDKKQKGETVSYYYNYFLGYMDKDKIVYPLGPYDMNGECHYIISRSRSFASDLHENFYFLPEERMSDRLKKEMSYENWDGEIKVTDLKFLPLNELPKDSFIRKGYFLIKDIEMYEKSFDDPSCIDIGELFWDTIPTSVYAQKMQNEITFGAPKPKTDEFGEEIIEHPCSDYAFYAYPDYLSAAYESFVIRMAAEIYDYRVDELREDGTEIVVLETEG